MLNYNSAVFPGVAFPERSGKPVHLLSLGTPTHLGPRVPGYPTNSEGIVKSTILSDCSWVRKHVVGRGSHAPLRIPKCHE